MHNHWLFIGNVLAHLVASMSGIASFAFSMWEHSRNKKIESRAFFIVGVLCLIIAFDQAWQDEHRNAETLTGERAVAIEEREFWKTQFYTTNSTLQTRDNLLAQNYGALTKE